ncbi:glycosyltransferase family 4 protein [Nocardioides baekrokdamisoli]|nr:glycosyltransferase family 4 protein [Nocardioides baekrokdamisoli]
MVVPSSYHPHVGGVESVAAHLARGLAERGHQPLVVTNRAPRDLPATEVVDGIEVVRIPFRTPHRSVRGMTSWALLSRAHRREFTALAREVDLIHVHCVSSNADYARIGARAAGVPLVVTTHGELTGDATGLYQRDRRAGRSWRRLAADADLVTAPSRDTLRRARAFQGADFEDVRVIPNGVDLDLFSGPRIVAAEPYVLMVGRLVPNKGFGDVIERWDRLSADLPHRLLIAGEGPDRARLEALRLASGAADRIALVGDAEPVRIAGLMRSASAVVVPSHAEAFGLVALEAMAAGTPVVAAAVGGLPDLIINGVTGSLAAADDPDALVAAVRDLLHDEVGAARRAAAAAVVAAGYGWDTAVESYLAAYELVLR